jgi:hypothetical protein
MSTAFAQDDVLKTPAVQAQMSRLYAEALGTFLPTTNGLTRKAELSFTVNVDGTPGPITSSGDWASDFLRVQHSDTAIVHTHPFGTHPRPSDGDIAIAVKLGIPNYELSHYALWVSMPDGTSHKVADVQWKHGQLVLKYKVIGPQNLLKTRTVCRGSFPKTGRDFTSERNDVYILRQLATCKTDTLAVSFDRGMSGQNRSFDGSQNNLTLNGRQCPYMNSSTLSTLRFQT